MKIGVLALQGDFLEHLLALRKLGVDAVEVRRPEQLEDLDGLIIPGGESTTFGKLMVDYGLLEPIRIRVTAGWPVWGTCAGAIVLARNLDGHNQPILGVMDTKVVRNAFGRQLQSFEADLDVPALGGQPVHAVFIRAPLISEVGGAAEVLARLQPDGPIVAARQGNLLATCFHPELTPDLRFHRYFVELVRQAQQTSARDGSE